MYRRASRLAKSRQPILKASGIVGTRVLANSDDVFYLDRISSNSTGSGEFQFRDGTRLAVGAGASLNQGRQLESVVVIESRRTGVATALPTKAKTIIEVFMLTLRQRIALFFSPIKVISEFTPCLFLQSMNADLSSNVKLNI